MSNPITLLDRKNLTNSNLSTSTTKTTNINILLNRVRTDEKKVLKKKIIFIFLLLGVVALFGTITLF